MSQIDLSLTEQIIKRLTASGALSLNVKLGDSHLRLVRGGINLQVSVTQMIANDAAGQDDSSFDSDDSSSIVAVTAQLVGNFRNLSKPVSIGQTVVEGQPLGNIESMSILNEISSPTTGVVSNIMLADGDTVQYGSLLFELSAVEPNDDELGI